MRSRLGAPVVALFAVAFTRTPWLIRLFNPVFERILLTPLPAGPNALLTVRGRRTGRLQSTPVAYLDLGDRGYLQAASASAGWARNLRASGEAWIRRGRRTARFEAIELAPERAGPLLHDLLAAFPRSRLIRSVVGPHDRPPLGVLHYFGVRVDDDEADYVSSATRQPLFELTRRS